MAEGRYAALLALSAPSWTQRAACRGTDPEVFFAHENASRDDGEAAAVIATAKAICGVCPVRDACLGWALEQRDAYGIWGGMLPRERRELLAVEERA